MKNIKKLGIVAIVLAICAVLGITAWAAGTSGVDYVTSLDNSSVCVGQKNTVTLTVELESELPVFMVSAKIDLPEGFTVESVENSTLGFETSGDHEFVMDSETNIFTWFVPTADNKNTKLLAKIVVNLPATQTAGTYKMGLSNIYLASYENGVKLYAEGDSISDIQLQIKNHSYTAKSKELASAANCVSPAHYYAACASCGVVSKTAPTLADGKALGHSWNAPTYVWAADGKSCTATRTCANNTAGGACVETEIAYLSGTTQQYVSAKITTPATCLTKGSTTYTATFKELWANDGTAKTTKTVQDVAVDKTNHESTEVTYEINDTQHSVKHTCCGTVDAAVNHDFTDGDCDCGAVALTVEGIGIDEYDSEADEGYSVSGRVVTVTYSLACKVGYLEDDIYVAIDAEENDDGSYSFTVPAGVTEVIVVVKGDASGDGGLTNRDVTMTKYVSLGIENRTFTAKQLFAADVTGDDDITNRDVTQIKAVSAGTNEFRW